MGITVILMLSCRTTAYTDEWIHCSKCTYDMVGGSDQYNTAYRPDMSVLRTRLMHMEVVDKLGGFVRMWVDSQEDRHTASCHSSSKNAYCKRK